MSEREIQSARPFQPIHRFRAGIRLLTTIALLIGPSALPARGQDETAVPTALPSAVAQFTSAVEDREPIDQVTFVSTDVRKIIFFSDLRDLTGHQVTHRWIYDGKTVAEVLFDVKGPRWRVWSSKDLLEDWIGDWTVEIVTDEGEVLAAETFTYSAPGA